MYGICVMGGLSHRKKRTSPAGEYMKKMERVPETTNTLAHTSDVCSMLPQQYFAVACIRTRGIKFGIHEDCCDPPEALTQGYPRVNSMAINVASRRSNFGKLNPGQSTDVYCSDAPKIPPFRGEGRVVQGLPKGNRSIFYPYSSQQ